MVCKINLLYTILTVIECEKNKHSHSHTLLEYILDSSIQLINMHVLGQWKKAVATRENPHIGDGANHHATMQPELCNPSDYIVTGSPFHCVYLAPRGR